ncbi:MAG: hypothetical protein H7831_14750 [Magnetococcus sp. WYHC-3]
MLKSLLSVVVGLSAMTIFAEDKEQNGTQEMTEKFPFYAQNRETLKSMKPFRIPQGEVNWAVYGIDGKTDDEKFWQIKDLISRYPMVIKLMEPRVVMLRLASESTILLPDNSWVSAPSIPKERIMTIPDDAKWLGDRMVLLGYRMGYAFQIEKEDRSQKVQGSLHLLSNSSTALGVKFLTAMNRYFGCSRMNTMPRSKDDAGRLPITVKEASFVANFGADGHETPSIDWAIGNLSGGFHVRGPETGTRRLLGEMANRVSVLFGDPPADVRPAGADGLDVVLNAEGQTHRVKVETPNSSPYSDWWLRIDTNVGELEVTAPGQAILKAAPKSGAIITVYAISPNGKEWCWKKVVVGQ